MTNYKIDVPEVLYKYRKWTDDYHKRLITHQELFFSKPSGFDDPKDCKNPIRYDLMDFKMKVKFGHYLSKKYNKGLNRRQHKQWAKDKAKDNKVFNLEYIKAHDAFHWEQWDAMFGVLSLTANPNNERMWIEYSDTHKGFCIGYHGSELFKLKMNLGHVIYESELPNIFPEPIMSFEEQVIKQIFYKEDIWEYEEEYRCTMMSLTNKPLSLDQRAMKIPPEAIKEIRLGKNMSDVHKEELKNSIPKVMAHVEIIEEQ